MLNLLSITKTVRCCGRQRRVNAGFPVSGTRLYILALLAGLTFVGCSSMPNIPPSLPGARLVPGTENCSVVVRGDEAVWWATDVYDPEWVKTDPQSHEVLARTRHPNVGFVTVATGFEAVWFAEASHPSVYKLDAQLKSPPEKISLVSSWRWRKGAEAQLAVDDHAVWATVKFLDKVFRIDPDTLTIVATIPVPGPTLVEAGEVAVWVISKPLRPDLVRIDPKTNRITATIPLDIYPFTITTGGGAGWGAFGAKVIRINPLTNKIEATFNVFWDSSPARYNFVVQMVFVEERLWALVFTEKNQFFWPAFFGAYALVEIDIKTNAIRMIHKLGSGEVDQMIDYSPQRRFTVIDDAAWVCLPTGLYVIPITDTGHPESGK